MRNSYEIARYVKRVRERKGMSAVELAKRMGVTKATISRYENGTRKISMDDIPKFADVLGVSPLDILIGDDREEEQSSEYPYIPVSISAGFPIRVTGISGKEMETISIPDRIMGKWAGSRDIFFMRVNGDSMDKVIPHNSLIAVKRVELHLLKDGDIVVYSNGRRLCDKKILQI